MDQSAITRFVATTFAGLSTWLHKITANGAAGYEPGGPSVACDCPAWRPDPHRRVPPIRTN